MLTSKMDAKLFMERLKSKAAKMQGSRSVYLQVSSEDVQYWMIILCLPFRWHL